MALHLPTRRLSFYDPLALHEADVGAKGEERSIAIGEGSAGVVLVVVHAIRGEKIRRISARRPTRSEVRQYEG